MNKVRARSSVQANVMSRCVILVFCLAKRGMAMNKLKPCPKCGRVPRITYAFGKFFTIGNANCSVCGKFTEIPYLEVIEIDAWNREAAHGQT